MSGFRFNFPARFLDGVIPPLPPFRARGSPPLMLIAAGSEFALPLAPPAGAVPAAGPAFPVAPPLASLDRFAAAPGVPGFAPSGEIEIRAARFPSGTLIPGDGGAGVAESAMMRCRLASPSGVDPISGHTL